MIKHAQLAAQMYTVREFTKTPEGIAESLAKIKAIGYEAVQLSGLGPVDDAVLAEMIRKSGLNPCASHDGSAAICDTPETVIQHLKNIGCKNTAYPWPHTKPQTREETLALASALEKSAQKFTAAGLTLSYHNHAIEFGKAEGELLLDIIYKNAPSLRTEIDTFWVQAGGQNPADWVAKFPGRQTLLHLKDFGIVDGERAMRPIGEGNLNWDQIFAAAETAGVEYYIVEQDVCQKDPFESLADSYRFITGRFVR